MEHGAANCFTKQPCTEVTMKTEVEEAAPPTAHIFHESNVNRTEGEPVLAQLVKTEPALLVKENILEDSSQAHTDGAEQQCVEGASTSAVVSPCDLSNVKHEPSDMAIGPSVLQHMDIHYKINQPNTSAATEENTILDKGNEVLPSNGVKKDVSVEDELSDSSSMQEVQCSEERKHRRYTCDKCCKVYKYKHSLRNHSKREHATESYKCNKYHCKKEFKRRASLLNHVRNAHSKERYECAFCKTECKSLSALLNHNSRFHRNEFADHTDREDQQCIEDASTSAGASLCDLLNVKHEPSDIDIGPSVLQHMDMYYKINQPNTSAATEENTILDEGNEVLPSSEVKQESVEAELRDLRNQRGDVSTSSPGIVSNAGEAADSANQRNIITIKEELEDSDLEIGTTVLQHMDSYYTNNQVKWSS